MIMRTPVTRVPIKLRQPIHKDFCKCWGIQVFSIEGIPQFINGDKFTSPVHLMEFLDEVTECLPIHFEYHDSSVDRMIGLCISRGIPVVVKTNKVLPQHILSELRKVPHSGIQISINFLDGLMRNRLERGASEVEDIWQMISLAKSWKIFVTLVVEHHPHLVSKLDLFEIISMVKNYISHILISYPSFSDDSFHELKGRWESLSYGSSERFKQCYMANVPTRTWVIRPKYKEDMTASLVEFLKTKKIGLEVLSGDYNEDRIRHMNSGISDLPLGIRPFFYGKDGDIFREIESVEGSTCSKCEKPIFT